VRVVIFCHSILSDWNHGNAHFLRGVVRELLTRGHAVQVFEPRGAWSAENLVKDAGMAALEGFRRHYPEFPICRYELAELDLSAVLENAHLVLVHEWNEPALVQRLGALRGSGARFRLLFHDTHHRLLTAPEEFARFDFAGYDGVLAFGEILRDRYRQRGWGRRAFTWHEAADVALFRPGTEAPRAGDLVWIGNWGDEERTGELGEYLLGPVQELGLACQVYGVRYPAAALSALRAVGASYGGWLPNYRVPEVFAAFRVTVHVPRRPYAEALRGIPTIRPFEALACGIPLVSAPWWDSEGLFRVGRDFLMARDGTEMRRLIRSVLEDPELARSLVKSGRETILARHTCAHRVNELLEICRTIGVSAGEIDLERSSVVPRAAAVGGASAHAGHSAETIAARR
jgi:spore maturation protein CgeB